MAKKEYTKLVIAIFANESAAQTAAENLKAWDKANDDVKAGAVGVLIADGKGGIKQDLVGPHATGKGATIGAILGLIAAIPTGGLSLLGGVVGGGVRRRGLWGRLPQAPWNLGRGEPPAGQ